MILAAALLLGAALVGWQAPYSLHRLTVRGLDPTAAIACWLFAMSGVALTAMAGVALLILPDHGPARSIVQTMHECWSALNHDALPELDPVTAMFSIAIVASAAARITASAVRNRRDRNRLHRKHVDALRILEPDTTGRVPTLWLKHDQPLAYSLGGRHALVVASQGLVDRLSARELEAVLAHEHAHLRGRHHFLVGLADVAGRALPFVPLMREAPTALRILVELAADRAAVRQCGAGPVRSALVTMTSFSTPPGALAMAGVAAALRLRRLDAPGKRRRIPARLATVVGAATAAISAPAIIALGLLTTAGLLGC